MAFYIYETQVKPDGSVNIVTPVSRSTEQLGKSFFHERCSKAYGSELYTEMNVMLVNEHMTLLALETCETSYVNTDTLEDNDDTSNVS